MKTLVEIQFMANYAFTWNLYEDLPSLMLAVNMYKLHCDLVLGSLYLHLKISKDI